MATTTYVEIAADTSKYERAMRDVRYQTEKAGDYIKTSWLQITGAVYAGVKAWEAAKLGARAQQEAEAFRNMAASYSASSDQIIEDLKRASGQTIDTMTLIEKAGTAMMMGINPEQLSRLMEIARATARLTGQEVTKAFEDISLGVGRQSKMILDNLGIIVNVEQANKAYAEALGKIASQLTEAERKQAFLNATVLAGTDLMKRMGEQTRTAAEMFQSFDALISNVKVGLGKGIVEALKYVMVVLNQAAAMVNHVFEQITGGWGMIFGLLARIPMVGDATFGALARQLEGISNYFRENREYLNQFTAELLDMGKATAALPYRPAQAGGPPAGPDQKAEQEYRDRMRRIAIDAAMQDFKAQQEMDERILEWKQSQADKQVELREELRSLAIDAARRQGEEEMEISRRVAEWQMQQEEIKAQYIAQVQANAVPKAIAAGQRLLAATQSQNAALFKVFQAFSAAHAVISAHRAAAKALAEVPWPYNWIEAAAEYTAAMAEVVAIRSAGPGGGGGGAVGTYSANPYTGLPDMPATTVDQSETKHSLVINIEGDFIGDEGYIEKLIEKINEAVVERDVRLVARDSKYAEKVL